MADMRVQLEVEDWVRTQWMPSAYGQRFRRERVRLSSEGVFDFDAVSEDETIVASISTSSSRTSGGRAGVGKIMKLRADMLFLLLAKAERRIMVLTEADMYQACLREREIGRVPKEIEFAHAVIPESLQVKLLASRSIASQEVSPRK
jgi:hypothetical protein